MKFPLGKMSVGDILDRGLKLLFARIPAYYAINLLVLSPVIALAIAAPFVVEDSQTDAGSMFGLVAVGLVILLFTVILQPIGTAAILHIIMKEYAGKRATVGEALSFAMTRFLALLGTSILAGLIILIGFICCFVPGVYFYVTYIFVGQVVVLEGLSGGGALERSATLVTGYRWRVFGVVLLILVGAGVVQFGVEKGLEAVLPSVEIIPTADGPRVEFDKTNAAVNTIVTQLVQILFTTFLAVCTTLLYLDLRIRKEGFDLELAAGGGDAPPPEKEKEKGEW
jgi:hypothetical protein